jgi:TonB family protein
MTLSPPAPVPHRAPEEAVVRVSLLRLPQPPQAPDPEPAEEQPEAQAEAEPQEPEPQEPEEREAPKQPPAEPPQAQPRAARGRGAPRRAPAPTVELSPERLAAYREEVRSRIEGARLYPLVSRRREEEGRVVVGFSLSPEGRIVEGPYLREPSRYPALNQAALEAVEGGAPYPPFDARVARGVLSFSVPISFSLAD